MTYTRFNAVVGCLIGVMVGVAILGTIPLAVVLFIGGTVASAVFLILEKANSRMLIEERLDEICNS